MGQMLISAVAQADGCILAAATVRPGHELIGRDAGQAVGERALGVAISTDEGKLFQASQVVIDFTRAEASARYARRAAETGTPLVIGTTGITAEQQQAIDDAAERVAIVQAPNMSVGVVLLAALVEEVARTLPPDFDIEIVEAHHRHKVDAPSGTALALGAAAAAGRQIGLESSAIRGRDGHTGARPRGAIGFASLRGGDIVGDHTVLFAGAGERIELTHRATSRQIYAVGALRAARWVIGRPPGRYDMRDVLEL